MIENIFTVIFGLVLMILVMTVPIAILLALANYGDSVSCANISKEMKRDHKYSMMTGCLIKDEDRYIPLSSYRVVK